MDRSVPHPQSETVAKHLVHNFISRYGSPLEIHTDQGRNFESEVFKETYRLLDVVKTRTSPYHPSSNGIIERFNATLVTMIRSYVDENQRNWDQHIVTVSAPMRSKDFKYNIQSNVGLVSNKRTVQTDDNK